MTEFLKNLEHDAVALAIAICTLSHLGRFVWAELQQWRESSKNHESK